MTAGRWKKRSDSTTHWTTCIVIHLQIFISIKASVLNSFFYEIITTCLCPCVRPWPCVLSRNQPSTCVATPTFSWNWCNMKTWGTWLRLQHFVKRVQKTFPCHRIPTHDHPEVFVHLYSSQCATSAIIDVRHPTLHSLRQQQIEAAGCTEHSILPWTMRVQLTLRYLTGNRWLWGFFPLSV